MSKNQFGARFRTMKFSLPDRAIRRVIFCKSIGNMFCSSLFIRACKRFANLRREIYDPRPKSHNKTLRGGNFWRESFSTASAHFSPFSLCRLLNGPTGRPVVNLFEWTMTVPDAHNGFAVSRINRLLREMPKATIDIPNLQNATSTRSRTNDQLTWRFSSFSELRN